MPAVVLPAGTKPVSTRVIGLLLAAVAALYVVAPAMQSATVPLVRSELGLTHQDDVLARVLGLGIAIVALAVAGRVGDLRGRRTVLTVSLAVLTAGCVILTGAFSVPVYMLGRILVAGSLAAVFVSCLAFMSSVYMPGRINRVMSGWLAAMSAGFVAAINLAPQASSVAGWRLVMALMALAAAAALAMVRRYLPETAPSTTFRLPHPFRTASRVAACVAAAVGLQLAPLWGWTDGRVAGLLAAAATAYLLAELRSRVTGPRRGSPPPIPGCVLAAALASGIALGFTQVVLATAVPALTADSGTTPEASALVVSAFGMGGAAGCLLVRSRRITPLTGGSLGLPLAALGMVMFTPLLVRSPHPVLSGCVVVALIGFGVMLALAPRMAQFLAAIPRTHLGINAALLPAAILLGTSAAQAFPAASGAGPGPLPDDAHQLLWVGTAVVAAAALFLGRPVVALTVTAAAGLQYALTETDPDNLVAVVAALAVGAGAGAVAWSRREQSDRLAQTRETAHALQHAVLHPIPPALGRLRLASLYKPATAGTGVGGDFLEALHTPYGTRVLIGDVRGKGLPAVKTVTDLLGCFRSQAYETPDLGELAARLDRQVRRASTAYGDDELFATAVLLQHHAPADELQLVNCGHLAPLAVADGRARELDVPALLPLGFGGLDPAGDGEDFAIRPHRVRFDHGTTLVVHTDGLSEARNSSSEFYPITEHLADAVRGTPDHLVRHLSDGVRDWTHHLADDIAVIAVARSPKSAVGAVGLRG
ncbi:MFS transporter [Yinghuangia seranimata]|uniref:MFS transporter n=1 Tax=Yinghuangia seranimata TaxID=408067 RepID=UPI00248B3ABF|nr:MFS transporter [Yinghuangia seranimata]MDI2129853.1 MFS transporter [Yinghuangia seranimata]